VKSVERTFEDDKSVTGPSARGDPDLSMRRLCGEWHGLCGRETALRDCGMRAPSTEFDVLPVGCARCPRRALPGRYAGPACGV